MLKIEWNAGYGWTALASMAANTTPGSLSNFTPDGGEVIIFACGTAQSIIMRAPAVIEAGVIVMPAGKSEDLAKLQDGESYEMDVTLISAHRCRIRWTHLTETSGERKVH